MKSSLGHYTILRSIGRGAMGEVFLAEDTKLDRRVALKVLPPELAGDPERLARFQREAKAAAAINHPGIVTLYTIEETTDDDGVTTHFLTMELVDGGPLREHITPEGLPLRQLLDWAVQLADAIAAAHAEGIVHRDLKPANIMVNRAGRLKILDFGLARPALPSTTDSAAMTADEELLTREGRILGTPAYMSPQQAEGREVDHRTDIFSFGVLLYELAVGTRPFTGGSPASVISAILRDEPEPITELKPELPGELAGIVRRCLQKEPDRRFQSAIDVRDELDALRREVASGSSAATSGEHGPSTHAGDRSKAWRRAVLAAIAIGVGVVALVSLRETGSTVDETASPTGPWRRSDPIRLTDLMGQEMFPNLSSDGKVLVFAHKKADSWDVYRQRVGGSRAISLTADYDGDDTMPALSPNDELIAFRSERDGGGIFVMGATGESVRRISDFGYNPSWAPDNRRLVVATEPTDVIPHHSAKAELWILDIIEGKATRVEGATGAQPAWSPNGHRIAYYKLQKKRARDIFTISAEGGEPVPVTDDPYQTFSPAWSPDGSYIFYRKGDTGNRGFEGVAIDERTGRVLGEPITLTETTGEWHYHLSIAANLGAYAVLNQRTTLEAAAPLASPEASTLQPSALLRDTEDTHVFDCSPDGKTLLVVRGGSDHRRLLAVSTDDGERRELARGLLFHPRWSPDGQHIAVAWSRSESFEIHVMRADGSELRAITDDPEETAAYPVWSPDGARIAYWHQGTDRIHLVDSDRNGADQGSGEPVAGSEHLLPWDWSPDGNRLLTGHGSGGIVELDLTTGEQRRHTESGRSPLWLGQDVIGFSKDTTLLRLDLESGAIAPLVRVTPPVDLDWHFARGPENRLIYYTVYDRAYDIWSIRLD